MTGTEAAAKFPHQEKMLMQEIARMRRRNRGSSSSSTSGRSIHEVFGRRSRSYLSTLDLELPRETKIPFQVATDEQGTRDGRLLKRGLRGMQVPVAMHHSGSGFKVGRMAARRGGHNNDEAGGSVLVAEAGHDLLGLATKRQAFLSSSASPDLSRLSY